MKPYDHKKIEKKWQQFWAKNKIYTTKDAVPGKDNFYLLVEFPYPSGNLHVGHWYAFAVPDMLARYQRMTGKNVLYPIGFDAFGLPAENAAIKNGVNPRKWTEGNIAYMKKQIASMGASFDWSREVQTIDQEYYKWTQWMFLQLFKKNLAYQKETAVNWCPKDKTVLANEQVIDGKCDRCGSDVIQRQMLQWNIKITDYADRLSDDLDALDWPNQIKESQRNWIGRSEGYEIDFYLDFGDEKINARTGPDGKRAHLTVFTTRPDTLYGGTYLVLAPEHPWVTLALGHKTVLKNNDEVAAYVQKANKKTEMERTENKDKTGVELKGVKVINPATGEEIPVWVADYVIGTYGTGAVMGVPAHDERDYEFAKKFNLPIVEVIEPLSHLKHGADGLRADLPIHERDGIFAIVKHWSDDSYLCLRYPSTGAQGFVSGGIEEGEEPVTAAKREILEETGYKNVALVKDLGGVIHSKFYAPNKQKNLWGRYRPYLFKLENDAHEEVAPHESAVQEVVWVKSSELDAFVNREDFRIALQRMRGNYFHGGDGIVTSSGEFNGLTVNDAIKKIGERFGRMVKQYHLRDWIVSRQRYWGVPIPIIHCPDCGAVPVPDKDLPVKLPEVKDYLPEGSGKSPLAKVEKFVNVKCPHCGGKAQRETDTLDTFVDSSWYFLRYTDPKNKKKFADAKKMASWMPVDLYSGGAEHTTMHLLYSRFWQKALFDMGLVPDAEPYARRMNRSIILGPDGQKMSKSRGNVIDPDEVVANLGADTVRMYLAFVGPYNEVSSFPWNPDGVVGVRRFLERVWRAQEYVGKEDSAVLNPILHRALKKVGEDIAVMKFNTAISQLMILLNAVEKEKKISGKQWDILLQMLAPFAPHMSEELWSAAHKTSIHKSAWPAYDPALLKEDTVKIAVQINGKTRGEAEVAANADKTVQESAAREAVGSRLADKKILRTIVVPGRLVNFVIEE